jgi:hypothetical protein
VNNDRSSLDVVVHDREFGATLNLSLRSLSTRGISMAGVVLADSGRVLLSSSLDIGWRSAPGDVALGDDGVFTAGLDGALEEFQYRLRSNELESSFTLTSADIAVRRTGIQYKAFALDDPIPLLVLAPIAGAVVGMAWLWQRHAKQDKSAGATIKDLVEKAGKDNRKVDFSYETESEVTMPGGFKVKAKSKFEARTGEAPAA